MPAFDVSNYLNDRSAFSIDNKLIEWANNTAFDQFTKNWCLQHRENYYARERYFPPNPKKFGDQIAVINFLNLQSLPSKTILDIGTGAGYFCKLANSLGHLAEGTELSEMLEGPITKIHKHYNINVFDLMIKKKQEIKLTKQYNYITAIRTMFNDVGEYFSKEDWIFFKEDLLKYVTPGGGIFLKTNYKFYPNGLTADQQHIVDAFGKPLQGWNSFTYFIKK